MFDKVDRHPSYGLLSISRCTSSKPQSLFGSSIQHIHTIRMRISRARMARDLNNDFYFPENNIIEIEMSQSQFAEFICSMNVGGGIPITINWLTGEGRIEPCPYNSKRKQFEAEFSDNVNSANENMNKLLSRVNELFEKKTALTKAEKDEIRSLLREIRADMNGNTDFLYKQFNEQMDKTTLEAKGEVEAFIQNKMNRIATIALAEKQNDFDDDDTPIIEFPDNKKKED